MSMDSQLYGWKKKVVFIKKIGEDWKKKYANKKHADENNIYVQYCYSYSAIHGCNKILQMNEHIEYGKMYWFSYQLCGDRNFCAGVHYVTLQVFMEEMTYTFDCL